MDHVNHLLITSQNFDRSLRFYRNTPGWSVERMWLAEEGRSALLHSINGMTVVLSEREIDPTEVDRRN
jgi:hypothetical protein